MKLKNLNEKQVVQTTEDNHKAFMKLLDENGYKWLDGDSYADKSIISNKFKENKCYNVKTESWDYKDFYKSYGYEIIPASKFLKPTKKDLLERIERIEKYLFVPITVQTSNGELLPKMTIKERDYGVKMPEPTEPKVGDLCAFTDDEMKFDKNSFRVGKLAEINNSGYPYTPEVGSKYKYARKVEIKFI